MIENIVKGFLLGVDSLDFSFLDLFRFALEVTCQNPSFIRAVLNLKPTAARVYLPPGAKAFLTTLVHYLRSKNYV